MKNVRLAPVIFATILVYVILHVTEEALGNFPLFMNQNWGIPNIGYARWLYHNMVLFLPVLLLGFFIYSLNETEFLPFGIGISLWGLFNFFEHIFYSVRNSNIAPGTYSAVLYLALAIIVFIKLRQAKQLNFKIISLSFLCSLAYWAVPIMLIMRFSTTIATFIK